MLIITQQMLLTVHTRHLVSPNETEGSGSSHDMPKVTQVKWQLKSTCFPFPGGSGCWFCSPGAPPKCLTLPWEVLDGWPASSHHVCFNTRSTAGPGRRRDESREAPAFGGLPVWRGSQEGEQLATMMDELPGAAAKKKKKKRHKRGDLTQQTCLLSVLGARSLKLRCRQSGFLLMKLRGRTVPEGLPGVP